MKKCMWIIVAFLFVFATGLHAEEPWKLAKEGDGIKVYTRPVPGSAANEFQGIADIDAPIEVIHEVFKDIPSFTQWYGFCKEIKQLQQDSDNHRVIYFVLKTMGPVKDRDMVVDTMDNFDRQAGRLTVVMTGVKEDIVPRQDKYVRMTDINGTYLITRTDPDKAHVIYTVKADPAGYIPAFISNILQKDQPFLTLKGLREMVKKDVYYQKAGIARK
jgi:START domain